MYNKAAEFSAKIAKEIGLSPKLVCEIGVHKPHESQSLHFIKNGAKVMMFEPLPDMFRLLTSAFSENPNVEIINVAIGDEQGDSYFIIPFGTPDASGSAYLSEISSPHVQTESTKGTTTIKVPVRQISAYDKGNIDLLLMDMEGAEWFALKHLISRPKLIIYEWGTMTNTYVNPFEKEIDKWFLDNNYTFATLHDGDKAYIL